MSSQDSDVRLQQFAAERSRLVTLAYRMLGDLGRAEDIVQDAWLRWQATDVAPTTPGAYLITIVTRLCLNELDSARARKEESRSDRLPEPIDLEATGLADVERMEAVSMAFGVILQRLTPAERAVLLLHDVFDFEHEEVARLVGKSAAACRKLLERARSSVRDGRRLLESSPDEHRRLLRAFSSAAASGDVAALLELLADDAVLMSDGGRSGRALGGQRNLARPLEGAARVAAFVAASSRRAAALLQIEERELNGQPALVLFDGERPSAAILLAVADGKIQRVFFHADLERLGHVGARKQPS
jgi:RNA polymerase sigma-70 factor (ECF subfamily)